MSDEKHGSRGTIYGTGIIKELDMGRGSGVVRATLDVLGTGSRRTVQDGRKGIWPDFLKEKSTEKEGRERGMCGEPIVTWMGRRGETISVGVLTAYVLLV
jgi:hypothetical protein